MKSKLDLIAIITIISGLGTYAVSLGLSDQIDVIAPGWGKKVLAFISLGSVVATMILRIIQNPTPTQTSTVPTASGGTVEVKTVAAETPQNGTP